MRSTALGLLCRDMLEIPNAPPSSLKIQMPKPSVPVLVAKPHGRDGILLSLLSDSPVGTPNPKHKELEDDRLVLSHT